MIFQRVNRTDPERVFVVVRASEAISADDAVMWETASASVDGVRVRLPDTGGEGGLVGVADAAISDTNYGLVQVYGYRSTSRVFQTNTSQDTLDDLRGSMGAAHLSSYVTSSAHTSNADASVSLIPAYFILAETIASSSASGTASAKIFIRCL